MTRKPKTERKEGADTPANPPRPELRTIPITNLLPDEKNPRKDLQPADPEYQKIKTSIEQFQFLDPIVFNSRTRMILGGHQRIKILKDSGITDLFVLSLGAYSWAFSQADLKEMPPAMETAANIALNKASGDWDTGRLVTALESIKIEGLDINITGFNEKELVTFMADLNKGKDPLDAEPQISRAEELRKEWGTELGQLWQCGSHKIICGDCTDPAVVKRVMGDEKARLVFTSPPYNSTTGGYKSDYYGKKEKFYQDKKTDSKTKEEWLKFCDDVLINCSKVVLDDSTVAWNVMYNADMRDAYGLSMFCGKHPFTVKETICWDKTKGFNIATKGILSRTWEFVFILSIGDKYFTTQKENEVRYAIWRINTNDTQISGVHNAAFPVGLPQQAIDWFSLNGDTVLDPFLGSGTTMIACENRGREFRGVEIDPSYVAVCLQRYKDTFPNKKIRLVKE